MTMLATNKYSDSVAVTFKLKSLQFYFTSKLPTSKTYLKERL